MSNQSEFKRLNFFTGFFTTAADWEDGQNYHLEKRKLHHRLLHKPGILEGLEIRPLADQSSNQAQDGDNKTNGQLAGATNTNSSTANDKLSVVVTTGVALDSSGNLSALPTDQVVHINPPKKLPGWVYLTIEFTEEHTDWDQNVQDPDYSGFRRVVERPTIVQSEQEPDGTQVELARIFLVSADQPITLPTNGDTSGGNWIDRSHARRAGARDSERDTLLEAVRQRIERLHVYHLETQRRQNQGLHTAGIFEMLPDQLTVVAGTGLSVKVKTGAALDGHGHQLQLNRPAHVDIPPAEALATVYIAARYDDSFAAHLADLSLPLEGDMSATEIAVHTAKPDGMTWIELARISMSPETSTIIDYPGQGEYGDGVINLQHRQFARAYGVAQPRLPGEVQEQLRTLMQTVRQSHAQLGVRFVSPSLADVRHVALNLQLNRASIEPAQLRPGLIVLADMFSEVEQELGMRYPPLTRKAAYLAFQDAVAALQQAIRNGFGAEELMTSILDVANAANNLAQVVFPPPRADAGDDQTIVTPGAEAVVTLDAGGSVAGEGHEIVRYRWEKEQ